MTIKISLNNIIAYYYFEFNRFSPYISYILYERLIFEIVKSKNKMKIFFKKVFTFRIYEDIIQSSDDYEIKYDNWLSI